MIIRKIEIEDLFTRVDWMNNPAIYMTMHYEVPVSIEKTQSWFERNKDNNNRCDVVFEDNNKIVAFGGLTNINKDVKKAELYIFVNPYLHKGGLGTTATKLLCKYGFNILNLNKIYLETNEDNFAARRVYQKCGFKLEGILREEYRKNDGQLLSRLYFGLLKGELNE